MAFAHYQKARITGIATVVPEETIKLDDESAYYNQATLDRLKSVVGLSERRVAPPTVTPGDMCFQAAEKLIGKMNFDKNDIDAIICVLDLPDYKCPPTACILQGNLGLSSECMAFDINHGCAGYVYGLNVAFSLVESSSCRCVLLLVGDAKTHTINIRDRVCAPLFGDGASATLITHTDSNSDSYFHIENFGEKFKNIIIPAGGARMPCSKETASMHIDQYGNARTQENFTMNGSEVFKFAVSVVPRNINKLFNFSGINYDAIDYAVLHQANRNIIELIAKRVGFAPHTDVPFTTLAKFGNLAVASIPSVINDQYYAKLPNTKATVLFCGFGVGLACASCILHLDHIVCPEAFVFE